MLRPILIAAGGLLLIGAVGLHCIFCQWSFDYSHIDRAIFQTSSKPGTTFIGPSTYIVLGLDDPKMVLTKTMFDDGGANELVNGLFPRYQPKWDPWEEYSEMQNFRFIKKRPVSPWKLLHYRVPDEEFRPAFVWGVIVPLGMVILGLGALVFALFGFEKPTAAEEAPEGALPETPEEPLKVT